MSRAKEAIGQFLETLDQDKQPGWARKTVFSPEADGSFRRLITRPDGIIEKDEIIPADRMIVAEARAKTGLSQERFAVLLGISPRTLRDWEQGRRSPSGAARTLLRIAATHPEILRELGR